MNANKWSLFQMFKAWWGYVSHSSVFGYKMTLSYYIIICHLRSQAFLTAILRKALTSVHVFTAIWTSYVSKYSCHLLWNCSQRVNEVCTVLIVYRLTEDLELHKWSWQMIAVSSGWETLKSSSR